MNDPATLEVHWAERLVAGEWFTGGSCSVYVVYSTDDELLYVGIADNFEHRWRQHVRQSWWIGEVEIDHVEVTLMPNRDAARVMEAIWINTQHPRYNTSPESRSFDLAKQWARQGKVPRPVEHTVYAFPSDRDSIWTDAADGPGRLASVTPIHRYTGKPNA